MAAKALLLVKRVCTLALATNIDLSRATGSVCPSATKACCGRCKVLQSVRRSWQSDVAGDLGCCSYAVLCYAMLCCAMLCYDMLCYAVLCYAILGLCIWADHQQSWHPACQEHNLTSVTRVTSVIEWLLCLCYACAMLCYAMLGLCIWAAPDA